MNGFGKLISAAACGLLMTGAANAAGGPTLSAVKERGALLCTGHNGSYLGLAEVDAQGKWFGFDIDMCRAFATAIFGTDEGHLNIIPISWAQRFPSLQSGEIDLIIKATGWTFTRDTDLKVQFSQPYRVVQSLIMAPKSLGATSLKDFEGGTVCVPAGTTLERYVAEYAAAHGITAEFISIEKTEELNAAYFAGRCDAYVEVDVALSTARTSSANPDDHELLPEVLKLEPLSIGVRENDDNFLDIANWLINALLIAEIDGVTSQNVDEIRASPPNPAISKLLGATPGIGTQLGLEDDWVYNVIKRFGNYGEIWERNLGSGSKYKISRGLNNTYREKGVLYPAVLD